MAHSSGCKHLEELDDELLEELDRLRKASCKKTPSQKSSLSRWACGRARSRPSEPRVFGNASSSALDRSREAIPVWHLHAEVDRRGFEPPCRTSWRRRRSRSPRRELGEDCSDARTKFCATMAWPQLTDEGSSCCNRTNSHCAQLVLAKQSQSGTSSWESSS